MISYKVIDYRMKPGWSILEENMQIGKEIFTFINVLDKVKLM